jgi:integrase
MARTLIIDREFHPIGRIKVASGTTRRVTLKRLNEMITALRELPRHDILRAIRDHQLTPLQVLEKWPNKLDELPLGGAAKPLIEAIEAWRETADVGEKYRSDLKYTIAHITVEAKPQTVLQELPEIVRALRLSMKDTPTAFNHVKRAAQAFVRDTLGRRHPVYHGVTDVEALTITKKRETRPQTPAQLKAITEKMDAETAAMAWSLASSGMRPVEYWSRRGASWAILAGYIQVNGQKSDAARRKVPLAGTVVPPSCWEGKFRDALDAASDGQVQTYDLRRSFMNWMEAAGIIRTRRKLYFGHSEGDVTSLYEWHQVEQFLEEDARRLREYIERDLAPTKTPTIDITQHLEGTA